MTKTINLWIHTNNSYNMNKNDVEQMKRKIHKGKKESNRLTWFHFKCLFYCVENDANLAECERTKPHLRATALSNPVNRELRWAVVAKCRSSSGVRGGTTGRCWPFNSYVSGQQGYGYGDCYGYFVRNKIQMNCDKNQIFSDIFVTIAMFFCRL